MKKHVLGLTSLSYLSLSIVLLASFLSFFAPAHFILDLLTHFRLQYVIGFLVLVGFFLIQKKPLFLFIATVGFITQFIFLLPYYFQPSVSATDVPKSTKLRVYFNNVNYGIKDFTLLVESITQHQPQVVGLVELSTEKYEQLKPKLSEYPFSYHVPTRAKMGLALFSNIPFVDEPSIYYFTDHQFPSIVASIQAENSDTSLEIIVIHPPPPIIASYANTQNELFAGLAEYVASHTKPLLIIGDFNSTGWSPAFQNLLADSALSDSRNNQGIQTSWPSQLPKCMRIPIDHMLTNQLVTTAYREVLPSVGSDHLPVLADFNW